MFVLAFCALNQGEPVVVAVLTGLGTVAQLLIVGTSKLTLMPDADLPRGGAVNRSGLAIDGVPLWGKVFGQTEVDFGLEMTRDFEMGTPAEETFACPGLLARELKPFRMSVEDSRGCLTADIPDIHLLGSEAAVDGSTPNDIPRGKLAVQIPFGILVAEMRIYRTGSKTHNKFEVLEGVGNIGFVDLKLALVR